MWHLSRRTEANPWMTVGSFETVAAARKSIELEGSSAYGVFFQIYIETGPGTHSEQEAFGPLNTWANVQTAATLLGASSIRRVSKRSLTAGARNRPNFIRAFRVSIISRKSPYLSSETPSYGFVR
jgi:hypothetical protein